MPRPIKIAIRESRIPDYLRPSFCSRHVETSALDRCSNLSYIQACYSVALRIDIIFGMVVALSLPSRLNSLVFELIISSQKTNGTEQNRCTTEKKLRTAKNTLKRSLAIKLHILIGPKAWWSPLSTSVWVTAHLAQTTRGFPHLLDMVSRGERAGASGAHGGWRVPMEAPGSCHAFSRGQVPGV
jgi:hypothetical protein